jgi:hypothetical protein
MSKKHITYIFKKQAKMMELVDMLGLGSSSGKTILYKLI